MSNTIKALMLIGALMQGGAVMGVDVTVNFTTGDPDSAVKMQQIPPVLSCNGNPSPIANTCTLQENQKLTVNRTDGKKPCDFILQGNNLTQSGYECQRWKVNGMRGNNEKKQLTLRYCDHRNLCP